MSDQEPRQGAPEGGVELAPGVFIPPAQLRFQFARASGPGGQNVNKLNTKAELWVPISGLRGLPPDAAVRLEQLAGRRLTREGEIHIVCETQRSQEGNRLEALQRLRELLIQAMHRPKRRRKTKPSRASRQRRLEGKKRRGEVKRGRQGMEG